MSKYTIELKQYCEDVAGVSHSSIDNIDTVLSVKNLAKIMSGINYPIFDENYRNALNRKILEHFYTREIGFETVGLFKFRFRTKMNEIMPLYNQKYKSELLEFNPLYDFEIHTNRNKTNTGEAQATINTTNKSDENLSIKRETDGSVNRETDSNSSNEQATNGNTHSNNSTQENTDTLYSETPQGRLTDVKEGKYLTTATVNNGETTSAQDATSETNGTSSTDFNEKVDTTNSETVDEDTNRHAEANAHSNSINNITNLETYIETVSGKRGSQSYSKSLEEFRNTFLNIDMEVIGELNELFMGIY